MSVNAIDRIRRFQRAFTSEVGVLDASFLGRGRPLGPARVLNAVGRGITEVSDIRVYLKLDSGLMSRLLRGLEKDGLIVIEPSTEDSRRRLVSLTELGQQEYAAYEKLSDDRAKQIIERHSNPEKLLAAVDIIAAAFGRERVIIKEVDPASVAAQECMEAYYHELSRRFQGGFDVNLSCDPDKDDMRAPRGTFLLAISDGLPVGCAGLKGTDKGYAEVKRVWVAPEARGLGIFRMLMQRVEEIAATLGTTLLRLDTNSALPEAVAAYRKAGWQQIDRFNEDPYPDLFFEKSIS